MPLIPKFKSKATLCPDCPTVTYILDDNVRSGGSVDGWRAPCTWFRTCAGARTWLERGRRRFIGAVGRSSSRRLLSRRLLYPRPLPRQGRPLSPSPSPYCGGFRRYECKRWTAVHCIVHWYAVRLLVAVVVAAAAMVVVAVVVAAIWTGKVARRADNVQAGMWSAAGEHERLHRRQPGPHLSQLVDRDGVVAGLRAGWRGSNVRLADGSGLAASASSVVGRCAITSRLISGRRPRMMPCLTTGSLWSLIRRAQGRF